jgi:hypothetical protein
MHGHTFLFGGVPSDVARVVISPDGAQAFDAQLLTMPSVLGDEAAAFVAPMIGAPTGTITTFDAAGEGLAKARFAPGVACWPGHPCPSEATSGELGAGTSGGTAWRLLAVGDRVELRDSEGNVLGSVDVPLQGLAIDAPIFGLGDGSVTFPFGVVPAGTTSVVLVVSDLPSDARTAELPNGEVAFWAPFGPPDKRATFVAFDRACDVVAAFNLQGETVAAPRKATDCQT